MLGGSMSSYASTQMVERMFTWMALKASAEREMLAGRRCSVCCSPLANGNVGLCASLRCHQQVGLHQPSPV